MIRGQNTFQEHDRRKDVSKAGRLQPKFHICPMRHEYMPSYKRMVTTLFPVRYPDKFFQEAISDSSITKSWAYCAILDTRKLDQTQCDDLQGRDHMSEDDVWRSHETLGSQTSSTMSQNAPIEIVAGIQARLELIKNPQNQDSNLQTAGAENQAFQIYIQTLGTLAPFRGLKLASRLLEHLIAQVLQSSPQERILYITAHVWEANHDALAWYENRSFEVGEMIPQYYRRLRPSGARVVKRSVSITDHLDLRRSERY